MTSRSIDSGIVSDIEADYVFDIVFLELLFDTDPVRIHNDIGSLAANGRNADGSSSGLTLWQGLGDLGQVDTIEQGELLSPFAVSATLSIAKEGTGSILEEINTQDWRNRPANMYIGTRSYATGLLTTTNIFPIFQGKIDSFETTDGEAVSLATVQLESSLREFRRASLLRFSNATQQRRYPGDLGMEYVAQMVNNTVRWGTDETISFGSRGAQAPVINQGFF